MSEKNHKKYHDKCVLFLDDAFCNDNAVTTLVEAGFVVEEFATHFPRSDTQSDRRQQSVKDPKIIQLCHRQGWLIITMDSDMRITHVEEIKKNPNVTILATSHNSCLDPDAWVQGIIRGKVAIERKFKKQERPWYAQINRQGEITVCKTIPISQTTRRIRPNEL